MKRILIIVSQFNSRITNELAKCARTTLLQHGYLPEQVHTVSAPGAFELPIIAQHASHSGQWAGMIAIGCVIRGATDHYKYVSSAVTHGLQQVSLASGLPIAFGVLTTDTEQQALERAGLASRDIAMEGSIKDLSENKGKEAAEALLQTLHALQELRRIEAL